MQSSFSSKRLDRRSHRAKTQNHFRTTRDAAFREEPIIVLKGRENLAPGDQPGVTACHPMRSGRSARGAGSSSAFLLGHKRVGQLEHCSRSFPTKHLLPSLLLLPPSGKFPHSCRDLKCLCSTPLHPPRKHFAPWEPNGVRSPAVGCPGGMRWRPKQCGAQERCFRQVYCLL